MRRSDPIQDLTPPAAPEVRNWQEATHAAPVAMFLASAQGSLLAVNPAYRALTNRTTEEAAGLGWLHAIEADQQDAVQAAWLTALAEAAPFEAELAIRRGDDSERWVRAIARPDLAPSGEVRAYSGVLLDRTEELARDRALREHQLLLETKLQKQSTLFNESQRLVHLGTWEQDLLADTVTWSEELYRIWGVSPQDFQPTFTALRDRIHPADRSLFEWSWNPMQPADMPLHAEYRLIRPDGTERHVVSWVQVVLDEAGRPVRKYGTLQDITERHVLETALRDSETMLRAIVDHASDAIFIRGFDGRYLFGNQALATLFGCKLEDLIGQIESQYFDPQTTRMQQNEDRQILDTMTPGIFERELSFADGRRRFYCTIKYPYLSHAGEALGIVGIARDITELRQAELDLRRSHAILAAEQEADLNGIVVFDEARRILTSNRRFQELWGLPDSVMETREGEAILTHSLSLVQDPERFRRMVEGLCNDREQRHREEVRLLDGRILEVHTAPLVSSQDEHFGRVWFFRNVTERRQVEESLREQYRKLQELDALKSNFVNAISHDLRTPLTSIMGYSEFLEDGIGGELTPNQHDFVIQIQQNTTRLERLVDDLLDFARMDAGTFKLTLKEADLAATAREVLDSLRPLAESARVELHDHLAGEPLVALMDAGRIERVLMNLISNALKFTGSGGTVTVSARWVQGSPGGDPASLRCEVRDTGTGIPPEELALLFQRFSQLSSGKQKRGTGLGLSISKALIEAHGGQIGVESQPGSGSTFWFTLPSSPVEPV